MCGGSLDHDAGVEDGARSDQGNQVRSVDGSPPFLRGLEQLEDHHQSGRPRAGTFGHAGLESDGCERGLTIALVVFRWIQCSAGKSNKASTASGLSVILATALGHLAPKWSAKALK